MQNTLLDILILGLLVLVFGSIYRTRPSARLRYWIIGWISILLHFAVLLANPVSNFWNSFDTSVVLATLALGGVSFLLAALRAKLGVSKGFRVLGLLCGPTLVYIFLTQFGIQNELVLTGVTLVQVGSALVAMQRLWRRHRLVVRWSTACIAVCSVWTAYEIFRGDPQLGVYPIFTQMYAINALLYWQDFRRWSTGVVTAIGGLIAWAAVFPCALAVASFAPQLHLSPEIWNLPKYFVEFGMILTLMEDEIITTSRQREQYRLLFDNNPHPMWIFDQQSLEFLKVNEAAVAHYGYTPEAFSRMTLRDLRLPEEVPALEQQIRRGSDLTLTSGPWTHIKRDGTQIKVEVAAHGIQFEGREARFALVQDVTERQQLHEQLVHQANHDILTGLPNRLLLKDRMERTLTASARKEEKAAVICLDLDRFKQINDRYGHHIGDLCLKHLADLLRQRLRAVDTVARSGGEEFTVLLGGLTAAEDAARVAQTLVEGIRQPFELEGYNLELAASLGIAIYPDDGTDAQALWRAADVAMYRAKNSGGNQYVFVSHELSSSASEMNEIEAHLRRALKDGGFEIYYQPLYTMGLQLCGFEALLRLHHPTLGMIGPERFIPIAEESGIIVRIGSWVLEEVCRQAAEWKRHGLPAVRIALNISPLQLMRADFSVRVREVLAAYEIDPAMLEIEMTETTVMRNLDEVAKQMLDLAEVGVHFSVDDFGTGYSSLRHLHQLPFTTLKIDRSFIDRIFDKDGTREIVQAILSLAHSLGMQVIAEGVEREDQLAVLRSMDCDQLQGYLLGRPQPATSIPGLILTRTMNSNPEGALSRGVAAPQPHIC
jgi:diguanylate cyclase (GGDEF)-like protein/PAS domain S-box-containing protein